MRDPLVSPSGITHYRVELLEAPELSTDGVIHGEASARVLIPWSQIRHAITAEIGEPEGVRTIVFDLVARERSGWVAYRFDADPGEAAMQVARQIAAGLGPDRPSASLKSIATDGIPTHWYPDLDDFEADAIDLVAAES
jgi:hypothetical protein